MTKAYWLGFICAATGGNFEDCPYDEVNADRENEHWIMGYYNGLEPFYDALKTL